MSRNFEVGDLVLINTPDARSSNCILVRTVKLKTRNGEMIRPASKLAFLEAVVE